MGVLYIIGTVAGVFSGLITGPVLRTPDYLAQVSANETPIIFGSLLVLTMGLALALGYVVFRGALEAVCYIAMAICWFFLIQVSRETAAAGASTAAYLQTLGAVFLNGNDSIMSILVIVFSLGSLMLDSLLYRSQLIARWISVWGFIAIGVHLSTAVLMMFRSLDSDLMSIISLPILVQEMVMAIWLIGKGFNPTALTSAQPLQEEAE
ncbi:MAG TPA: DUF4386 domain-containing protein [Symbiobacteriaceae bacterium]|nr:DUF4386 domain-containing protein [Symbiobacteriaceae bacterium]